MGESLSHSSPAARVETIGSTSLPVRLNTATLETFMTESDHAGIPHSIQALSGENGTGCEFLLVFDDGSFSEDETFLVTDWLAHVSP